MREILTQFGLWSAIDILIIAFVVYHLLLLVRGTRTAQILTGVLIVSVSALILSMFVPLTAVNWAMNKFYSSFIVIIVVLFQDDIRRVLSRLGKKPIIGANESVSSNLILDEITRAATYLAGKKIGALIVIERNILLSRYVEIGIKIDARVSMELFVSIFHPTSPIHDGAVIVQQGRVSAAGCFLPLAQEEDLDHTMGTRHRAAFGISQETDAVVVLVSEERGAVAIICDGRMSRRLDPKELRRSLWALIVERREMGAEPTVRPQPDSAQSRPGFWGIFKSGEPR